MLRCPRCLSSRIYRTRTKSLWALLRRRLTAKRPHICKDCRWRGWGEETGPKCTDEEVRAAARALNRPLDVRNQLATLDSPQDIRFPLSQWKLPVDVVADRGKARPAGQGDAAAPIPPPRAPIRSTGR
jgi:hypothetical protein